MEIDLVIDGDFVDNRGCALGNIEEPHHTTANDHNLDLGFEQELDNRTAKSWFAENDNSTNLTSKLWLLFKNLSITQNGICANARTRRWLSQQGPTKGLGQLDGIAKDVKVLERDGVAFEVLDRQGCIAVEPGLAASKEAIAGGLRLPGDETGDCHKFTTALAQLAEQAGVRFEYETSVDRLVMNAGMLDRVVTDRGDFIADRFIIAAGSHSPRLTRQLGITLPVFPVKGYSLTMPVIDDALAPQSTLDRKSVV